MIYLIACMASDGVIGKAGKIPWHVPEELAWFKSFTEYNSHGNHVKNTLIMGRKTWETLPKLANRTSVVISRTQKGLNFCDSLEKAVDAYRDYPSRTFIIGGAEIYREALVKRLADEVYLSVLYNTYEGDTHFPFSELIDNYDFVDTRIGDKFALRLFKRKE